MFVENLKEEEKLSFGLCINTPCLSAPAESTPESCLVKIWPAKPLPTEKSFPPDFSTYPKHIKYFCLP